MSYLSDASLVMIPSGVEAGTVFTSKPAGGSADLTFTRSNDTATRVGPNGYIEKVRTNAVLHSEDQSNAAYNVIKQNITSITSESNPLTGTNNAYKVLCNGSADPYVGQQVYGLSNGENTFSCWLWTDSGESTEASLFFYNAATTEIFSETLTITTTPTRYSIIADFTSIGALAVCRIDLRNASGSPTYLYTYGWQAEVGSVATDYIETTTAAVSVGPVANVPRISFDPVLPRTGSLLLEPQRTNLITYSEQLDNASWTKNVSTITANNATSPDGYQNADLLSEATFTNDSASAYQTLSVTASVPYTTSVFLKQGAGRYAFIRNYYLAGGHYYTVVIDLQTGTITQATAGGSVSGASSTITAYGNGWYRVTATQTSSQTSLLPIFGISDVATPTIGGFGQITVSSNDGRTILLYGCMTEAGSYATSYIPTYSAAVTRGDDTASKTGISSLIGQTEGTLFFEYIPNVVSSSISQDWVPIGISDGTSANSIYMNDYNDSLYFVIQTGGVIQMNYTYPNLIANNTYKIAIGYANNDAVVYINGTQVNADTSVSVPSMSKISLNSFTSLIHIGSITVNKILLFQTRLTNDQLSQITTL